MQQTNKYTSIKCIYHILIRYNIFRSLLLPTPGRRTIIQTIHKQALCFCDRASWAKREEGTPTRCNNIDDLLSIADESSSNLHSAHTLQQPSQCSHPTATFTVLTPYSNLHTLQQPSQCSHPTSTFTVLTPYNVAPQNCNQPHPTLPAKYPICSNTWSFLLMIGIKMLETCGDISQ